MSEALSEAPWLRAVLLLGHFPKIKQLVLSPALPLCCLLTPPFLAGSTLSGGAYGKSHESRALALCSPPLRHWSWSEEGQEQGPRTPLCEETVPSGLGCGGRAAEERSTRRLAFLLGEVFPFRPQPRSFLELMVTVASLADNPGR